MTPRHSRGGRGHIGEGEGAEASGFDADGKIYRLDSRASSRMTARRLMYAPCPRSFQAACAASLDSRHPSHL